MARKETGVTAEKVPRWLVTRSVGSGGTLGILWLLIGLAWFLPDLAAKTGPAHWIAAFLGFLLSVSYFASAWWLRRQTPTSAAS